MASVTILNRAFQNNVAVGDGFAKNSYEILEDYTQTVPGVCVDVGVALRDTVETPRCKAVELTQHWPFGLWVVFCFFCLWFFLELTNIKNYETIDPTR